MNSIIRHATVATAATLTAIALAACGSTSTRDTADQKSPAASTAAAAPSTKNADAASGPHNAADVAFATGMVPHHQQAVTMSDMAKRQATNPKVKALAADIQAAQGPEIETMTGWLTAWGQPAQTGGGHDMANMNGASMGGMMTDGQMQQLGAASGAAFDRMWLQLMVAHHKGAVEMSDVELRDGKNAGAKKLAQQIIDAQKREITVMEQLLSTITG